MENRNVLDIFVSRGMIDSSLAEDMLHEMDASGKDVGDILTDFQVVQSREDMWGIIAQELGADLVDLSEFLPPEELKESATSPESCLRTDLTSSSRVEMLVPELVG